MIIMLCIIQARMSSKRLKGKVLMELNDEPILGLIIRRLKNRYYRLKSDKIKQSYQETKFSGLTIEEFELYTSKICDVLKIKYKDILVKEIYPGCYCIEKKIYFKN